MIEKTEQDKSAAEVTPSVPMVEKRVTKTVIRRRAAPARVEEIPEAVVDAPGEVEAAVEALQDAVEAVYLPPVRTEEHVTDVDVMETAAEAAPPEAAEPHEEAAPEDAVPEPQGPQGPAIEADSPYAERYTRLKVLAKLPEPPKTRIVEMPQESARPRPVVAGGVLGRKEIIEVRDMHIPKGGRRKRMVPGKRGRKTEITTPKAIKRVVKISESVTVTELARRMSVKAAEVIRKLIDMGMMVTINQSVDLDTASLVASEFGYEVENIAVVPEDLLLEEAKGHEAVKPQDMEARPPVVTVMGHVDHGKTSILDAIRKTDVAAKEAGGITQHIGAYSVKTESGRLITFVDTPGHEAFTAMRARGAQVTDLVILVVAADDGVMPQTREAVNHARAAKVPILVAINKMDKPNTDPQRVKKDLTEFEMVPEEWGGDTIYVPVSAKTGEGIPQLLEMILLQADLLDFKAPLTGRARGTVVEALLDKHRGPSVRVLVRSGTLKDGDDIVVGAHFGRVRALLDDRGRRVREAGPSQPVEVMGLSGVPESGDEFVVVADEKRARQVSELRQKLARGKELAKTSKVSLDDLYQKIEKGDVKELNVVVKADTQGSVEVLGSAIERLSTGKVTVRVIHGAVGGISESDVTLAVASNALVIGFNVRADSAARVLAERQRVDVRYYDVIYQLTADVQNAMRGLLAPKRVEKHLGRAEVRQIFVIQRVGTVAGCSMSEGKMMRSARVRLLRDNVQVFEGRFASLKHFKDDVREVSEGQECGCSLESFNDVKVGDVIEAYEIEEVRAELD